MLQTHLYPQQAINRYNIDKVKPYSYIKIFEWRLTMKSINVVAAVIRHNDKVFATRRGYGEFAGGWEFPGGKIEPGETPEDALIREIREELATDIRVEKHITTVDYDYPNFHLNYINNTGSCQQPPF